VRPEWAPPCAFHLRAPWSVAYLREHGRAPFRLSGNQAKKQKPYTMRTKRIIGAAVLLLTSTWCLQVWPSSLVTDGLRQVSPDQLPRFGTFWVAGKAGSQLLAPLPCLPPDDTDYPIFDLGGGSYLIAKDPAALNSPQVTQLLSDVAQAQDAAANNLTASLNNRSNPLDGPIPDGPDPLSADVFHVETLTLSNGFLVFNIEGLTPGDTYLLCRKTVLDDNFTNYWVPQRQFTTGASNRVASIPLPNDSSIGFYLVVDYDLYQGPAPTIVTPADNSTVSGIIQVKASLTDILPATQATLYVDGNNFGTITNGPATWNLDTARMANGSHTIEAKFLSWYYTTDDLGSNSVAPCPLQSQYHESIGGKHHTKRRLYIWAWSHVAGFRHVNARNRQRVNL
jgi:hypothetical protein